MEVTLHDLYTEVQTLHQQNKFILEGQQQAAGKIENIDKALNGNGDRLGLKTRITVVEKTVKQITSDQADRQRQFRRAHLTAAASLIVLIINLVAMWLIGSP